MKWIALSAAMVACASPPRHGVLAVPIDTTRSIALTPLTEAVARGQGAGKSEPVYFEFQVERPVRPTSSLGALIYPKRLREEGVQGTVIVQFIVDTAGRADMSTFLVVRATHPLFAQAVRSFLVRTHYLPAALQGAPVRQLVQQSFDFTLHPPPRNPRGSAHPRVSAYKRLPFPNG
jgi:TonB family protein